MIKAAAAMLRELDDTELGLLMEGLGHSSVSRGLIASQGINSGIQLAHIDLQREKSEYAHTLVILDDKGCMENKDAFRTRHLANLLVSGICKGAKVEVSWKAELQELLKDLGNLAYLENVCESLKIEGPAGYK